MIMNDELNDEEKALVIATQQEKEYIETHCVYFIDTYGWVEDKDSDGGKSRFRLWKEQKRVIAEWKHNRLNIVLKARQLGITWLALWFALWNMMFHVGYTVVALSKRDEDSKELVNRLIFMLEKLPKWLVMETKKAPAGYGGLTYETTTHEVTIHFGEGKEDARFIAMPAARDSGRSFTASLVLLDEWAFQQWADEIWTAAYPTINRPTGGKVIGLSTAKRITLFQYIWDHAKDFNFHRIFLAWSADPRRTPEWYEQTKKALSKDKKYMQEYPATPEEAFSAGDGTSFPEFSRDIHVIEPFKIPEHWRRWASLDNGYNDPFAFFCYAVDEDGTVYVYREVTRDYEDEKMYYTEQAKKFMEYTKYVTMEDGQPVEKREKLDYIVAGLDAWNTNHRDQTGKDLIDYYKEGGITYPFIKAVTDRKLRKATVHEYLKPIDGKDKDGNVRYTAKVQIFANCTHLINSLPQLLNDEHDCEAVADQEIDHWYDSFGYGLISYHAAKTKTPEKDKTVIQKDKDRLARQLRRTNSKQLNRVLGR